MGPVNRAQTREDRLDRHELLSIEQLARHARELSRRHRLQRRPAADRLLARLHENARTIDQCRRTHAASAATNTTRIAPAAVWLLDNHHLIAAQVQLAKRHLPRAFSRWLPRLVLDHGAVQTRVYDLVLAYIADVDGTVEQASLISFIAAYQELAILDLGELWAVPIMLRLGLIDNIRHICDRLNTASDDRLAAQAWADRLVAQAATQPSDLILVVADLARAGLTLRPAFVAALHRRLSNQHSALNLAVAWLENHLDGAAGGIEGAIHQEQQDQAADQLSMTASINSLRRLDEVDWSQFVEAQSAVEQVLRQDPDNVHARSSFATRDRCRHHIEHLARRSHRSELAITQEIIELAASGSDRERLVSWWLIGAGHRQLARKLACRDTWRTRWYQALRRFPLASYLGSVTLLTGGATVAVLALASSWPSIAALSLVAVLVFCALSSVALALVQRAFSRVLPPRPLARLDFSEGIPDDQRCLVVIPCLLSDAATTERLIMQLELHYLGNPEPSLGFALLSDFSDAQQEHRPDDAALLELARAGVERLNTRHGAQRPFVLLHRPRIHAPAQQVWMGRERKRGKLAELGRLLLHGDRSPFSLIVGDQARLMAQRSVIVLDADTQLPAGCAAQLVGAIAHPLNRPVLNARGDLVVAGHGIIQPRLAVTLTSANASRYAQLSAGQLGVDPYTQAVSDTYQDLFDEGSFLGKGIYDVATCEAVLGAAFPADRILSHDLIEGCYLRSGLDSETTLYEEQPARYLSDLARRQRWLRGDWQIARWLWPRPPAAQGPARNPLSMLSRWKIADNLRRHLSTIAWMLLLLATVSLPSSVSVVLLGAWFVPYLLGPVGGFAGGQLTPRRRWRRLRDELATAVLRGGVALSLLPQEAVMTARTIVRTAWQLRQGRRLLAWTTAAANEQAGTTSLGGTLWRCWPGPAAALVLVAATVLLAPGTTTTQVIVAGLAAVWLGAGLLAWWLGRGPQRATQVIRAEHRPWFRRLARQSYAFFEDMCGPADHFLPPDNIHLLDRRIAHRTSPTNIGMKLLADLGARDLGHLGLHRLLDGLQATLVSVMALERHRGHLLNWYDTTTLTALMPRMISSVDSGNFVGHCLVVRQGLLALADQPVWSQQQVSGLRDTWAITASALDTAAGPDAQRERIARALAAALDAHPADPRVLRIIERALERLLERHGRAGADGWVLRLQTQVQALRHDLDRLHPWPGTEARPAATLRSIAALAEDGLADAERRAAARAAGLLLEQITALSQMLAELVEADFGFLLDARRKLLVISYQVDEQRSDEGCYDLLASESRLTSYLAVAKRQLPIKHWLRLGRTLVNTGRSACLASWSGSMFEYLMPNLVMPCPPGTLLYETCRQAVRSQIAYGAHLGTPWGISESGYARSNHNGDYRYRAFGVPALGLKRGLADDRVIAPYASVMAVGFAPDAVWHNLQRLIADGAACTYGLVEAVDYTATRLPPGSTAVVVQQVMAHHQGMALVALVEALCEGPMCTRFLNDRDCRAAELLLHERSSLSDIGDTLMTNDEATAEEPGGGDHALRIITQPGDRDQVGLLANGRYQVMIGAGGDGWSRWGALAVTRWREDPSVAEHGTFLCLRDHDSGRVWSISQQPLGPDDQRADDQRAGDQRWTGETIFSQSKIEFRRQVDGIDGHLAIAVSPEDDVEVRRLTLHNTSAVVRRIGLTSMADIIIARPADDEAHPAFSNLFITSEALPERGALLVTRRGRSPADHPPHALHLLHVHAGSSGPPSWSCDRTSVIGRGRSGRAPLAMDHGEPLDGRCGSLRDPLTALRQDLEIAPGASVRVDVVIGIASERATAVALVDTYSETRFCDRVFELAWTHADVALQQLEITTREAQSFARMAGALIHATPHRRAPASQLAANRQGRRDLWRYGISGDLPIALIHLDTDGAAAMELVRMALLAHAWWDDKGLAVDLVLLVDDRSGYRQELADAVLALVQGSPRSDRLDRPAGVMIRRGDDLIGNDRRLFADLARVVLRSSNGTWLEQADRSAPRRPPPMPHWPMTAPGQAAIEAPLARRDDLQYRNPWGGFTRDGREYVLVLAAGERPPQPWINVLANPHFGCVVSESGGGYTWLENCHEARLTPWYNDAVSDRSGEMLYLRDEATGRLWSPTPNALARHGNWVVRHGFGYSVFEHCEDRIASELWTYVAIDAPVRLFCVQLRNLDTRRRAIGLAACIEWVLGERRSAGADQIVTAIDPATGALTARHPQHADFGDRIAFFNCSERDRSWTGDRTEFIGSGGSLSDPAALRQRSLSNRSGAGLDPCAAMLTAVDLAPGEERTVVFSLGIGADLEDMQQLVHRFRSAAQHGPALQQVWDHWGQRLGSIHLESPDPATNHLVNGWLLYQTQSCRLWARSGFYQSGGAYGFRDQLQDVMALMHADPACARAHLIRCAGRQFAEGDVQHWWHPPAGQGVRTHFSDDLLWLPLAVARYVEETADTGVLAEVIPFLESAPLPDDVESRYEQPVIGSVAVSLYEHGARSIDLACTRIGRHGLPLIGCGDWNDGMNLVGEDGRGESVWLAFFLWDVIRVYLPLARSQGDTARLEHWQAIATSIIAATETSAWDGAWYRRACMDDGQWLGTAAGSECQIDALPQSWAVLTGAGDPQRAEQALAAVRERLIDHDTELIKLFDPPFTDGVLEPGYIKGYPPGVRENGGQYTHAALWTIMAVARQRQADEAWSLFDLINPIHHGCGDRAATYAVEPYVIAADVGGAAPHTGRGGWTWYTGSAGWCHRLLSEELLGLRRAGDSLTITPLLRSDWPGCTIHYRHRETTFYHIVITRRDADQDLRPLQVDGQETGGDTLRLVADGGHHHVRCDCR